MPACRTRMNNIFVFRFFYAVEKKKEIKLKEQLHNNTKTISTSQHRRITVTDYINAFNVCSQSVDDRVKHCFPLGLVFLFYKA